MPGDRYERDPVDGEDGRDFRLRANWPSVVLALFCLVLGGAAGVVVGTGADAKTRTITQVRGKKPKMRVKYLTVTQTQTVTETETVTETTSGPDPPARGGDDQDGDGCSDSYDEYSCVEPYTGVDDVNCPDVGATDIEVLREPYDDPYNLDGYDQDGIACES